MKKTILFAILLFTTLVAACTGESKNSTVLPSNVPLTLMPTDVPPTRVSATEAVDPTAETAPIETATLIANLPRFKPVKECFATPPEELGLQLDMDCGYVVVPEFHNGSSNRELKLGITRINSGKGTAAAPLLILSGGPGQTNISSEKFTFLQPELLGKILETRDIVFVEQRGTEYTDTLLDCPATYSAAWNAHEKGLSAEEAAQFYNEIIEKCIDDFKQQGINFDAYNSVENAADVNDVREALGYDKIIYYGASYGSQLGQHVMRDFPGILEAVVLDGASPLSRKSWAEDRSLDAQWGIDNLTKLCDADEKCKEVYDIPALIDGALALFDNGPLPFTYTDPNNPTVTVEGEITVNDFVNFIYGLQGDKLGTFSIPAFLYQIKQGGSEIIQQNLGDALGNQVFASHDVTKGEQAALMHAAMVCSDDPVHSVDEVNTEGAGEYATLFGQGSASTYILLCDLLNVKELPDSTDVNVMVDVPTLLLTGNLDVQTPTFRSQLVADALSNATLITFPGTTHVQINGANSCAAQIMTQFVIDPVAELDTSCTKDLAVLEFVLPEDSE